MAGKANCIIMIDEFTEENGCTEVIPSSHKQTRRPIPDTADEKGLIKITGEPGDAIITRKPMAQEWTIKQMRKE